MADSYVTYYVTRNRLSPFVMLFGKWPDNANLTKSCQKGVRLFSREATPEEAEFEAQQPRHTALRWESLLHFCRSEGQPVIDAMRTKWPLVRECLLTLGLCGLGEWIGGR